jgi:hypothetical protein
LGKRPQPQSHAFMGNSSIQNSLITESLRLNNGDL